LCTDQKSANLLHSYVRRAERSNALIKNHKARRRVPFATTASVRSPRRQELLELGLNSLGSNPR
jgi:hypothetical protein